MVNDFRRYEDFFQDLIPKLIISVVPPTRCFHCFFWCSKINDEKDETIVAHTLVALTVSSHNMRIIFLVLNTSSVVTFPFSGPEIDVHTELGNEERKFCALVLQGISYCTVVRHCLSFSPRL